MIIQSNFYNWPRATKGLIFFLLLLTILSSSKSPLAAQTETPDVRLEVEVGFDGYSKLDEWIPISIVASNDGPPIEGDIRVISSSVVDNGAIIYSTPLNLPTNSSKRISLIIAPQQSSSPLVVELTDGDGKTLAQETIDQEFPLSPQTLLYGVISSDPAKFNFLENIPGLRDMAATAFLNIDAIPDNQTALNALDILIFDNVDTSRLTSTQMDALISWVEAGGQLVVTGGANWQKSSTALKAYLPVDITGTKTVEDLPGLRAWAGMPFPNPGPYILAESALRQGEVLLNDGDVPLLARRSVALGSIYFLALDPKIAPLAGWAGQGQLWAEIAERQPHSWPWDKGFQNSYNTVAAVSALGAIKLPSSIFLLVFLCSYILIIGPLNYLVLSYFKRRELAWISVPFIGLIFCGFAYLLGLQFTGGDLFLNQVSLATGHIEADKLRVQSVLGFYSPQQELFNLSLPTGSAVRPFTQLQGPAGNASNFHTIQDSQAVTVEGLHSGSGDLPAVEVENYTNAPNFKATADLRLNNDTIQLQVRIENNEEFSLENGVLIVGETAVPLGDIPAGAQIEQTINLGSPQQLGSNTPLFMPRSDSTFLTSNAEVILGTPNFIDDEKSYSRWQLLLAIDGGISGDSNILSHDDSIILLVGWSSKAPTSASIDRDFESMATTLYILQLPITGDQTVINELLLNQP